MCEHKFQPAFRHTVGDQIFIPDEFGGVFGRIEAVGDGMLTLCDTAFPNVRYVTVVPRGWTEWGKPGGVYLPVEISIRVGTNGTMTISNGPTIPFEVGGAYALPLSWQEVCLLRDCITV